MTDLELLTVSWERERRNLFYADTKAAGRYFTFSGMLPGWGVGALPRASSDLRDEGLCVDCPLREGFPEES